MKNALWFACLALTVNPVWAESPYTWVGAVTLESISNLSGGLATGSRQLVNLDASVAVDTAAAGWWSNGEWFAYVLGDYGRNPSALTGDAQGVSNIATDNNLLLYEFWYRHSFAQE